MLTCRWHRTNKASKQYTVRFSPKTQKAFVSRYRKQLEQLQHEIHPIKPDFSEQIVKNRSRDQFYRSPILRAKHNSMTFADCLLQPTNIDDLLRSLSACAKLKLPLTLRGQGSCCYGTSVPTQGGVILDMSRLKGILDVDSHAGTITVLAGTTLHDTRMAAVNLGWDLRVFAPHPHLATVAGFTCTASHGIGSVEFGSIANLGNIKRLRIATVEENPRLLDINVTEDANDIEALCYSMGTTAIITQLTLSLTPLQSQFDYIVAFDDLGKALSFGEAVANSPAVFKRDISVFDRLYTSTIEPIQNLLPPKHSVVMLTVSNGSVDVLDYFINKFGGKTIFAEPNEQQVLNFQQNYIWDLAFKKASSNRQVMPYPAYVQAHFTSSNDVIKLREAYSEQALLIHAQASRTASGNFEWVGLPVLTNVKREEEIDRFIQTLQAKNVASLNPHGCAIDRITANLPVAHKGLLQRLQKLKSKFDPTQLLNNLIRT